MSREAFPGPRRLGRGVVVSPGHPALIESSVLVTVDSALLGDEERLAKTVDQLHRAWVGRERVVVELGIGQAELRRPAIEESPPWQLGPDFTFLLERLHFLVWANNWDLRSGSPIWWWARKAAALGAPLDSDADVVFQGVPTWVDGGPRGPLSLPVIHAESVESGRLALVPSAADSGEDLASDQQAAVNHRSGPARIIAPAGSGKTRTLNAPPGPSGGPERYRALVGDRGRLQQPGRGGDADPAREAGPPHPHHPFPGLAHSQGRKIRCRPPRREGSADPATPADPAETPAQHGHRRSLHRGAGRRADRPERPGGGRAGPRRRPRPRQGPRRLPPPPRRAR